MNIARSAGLALASLSLVACGRESNNPSTSPSSDPSAFIESDLEALRGIVSDPEVLVELDRFQKIIDSGGTLSAEEVIRLAAAVEELTADLRGLAPPFVFRGREIPSEPALIEFREPLSGYERSTCMSFPYASTVLFEFKNSKAGNGPGGGVVDTVAFLFDRETGQFQGGYRAHNLMDPQNQREFLQRVMAVGQSLEQLALQNGDGVVEDPYLMEYALAAFPLAK